MVQNYKKAMKKFDDWLYILFIGIALVSSLISSLSKAKKQRENPPPDAQNPQSEPSMSAQPPRPVQQPETRTTPSWMEILQNLEEKISEPKPKPQLQTQTPPPPPIMRQPKAVVQPKVVPITSKLDSKDRFQSRISRKIGKQDSLDANLEYATIEIDMSDGDEIKKGIVYSEIINRRY